MLWQNQYLKLAVQSVASVLSAIYIHPGQRRTWNQGFSPYLPLNAALPLATRAVMVMRVSRPVLREDFVQYFPKQAVGWNSIKQAWEFLG